MKFLIRNCEYALLPTVGHVAINVCIFLDARQQERHLFHKIIEIQPVIRLTTDLRSAWTFLCLIICVVICLVGV